jgi:ABC-type polysaccharide/polyol phosphate export permease
LAVRALKVRYRRSILGFGWMLLYPVAATAVLTAVFSGVFPQVEHYAVHAAIGVLLWNFLSQSSLQAMDALIGGAAIMRKVYVPSAVFPLSAVAANLVNLLASGIALAPLMLWLGGAFSVNPLFMVFGVVCLAAFVAGLSLGLAAANLFFHDIRYFFEAVLLVWFYATPVVYPASVLPQDVRAFLWLNPAHWFLELIRIPLCSGLRPEAYVLAMAGSWATASVFVGWWAFTRLERSFHLYW